MQTWFVDLFLKGRNCGTEPVAFATKEAAEHYIKYIKKADDTGFLYVPRPISVYTLSAAQELWPG